MVSLLIDGILICICILIIFTSVRRGFVKTILSLAASVASVLLAAVLTPPVSGFFYDKFILASIKSGISDTVLSLSNLGTPEGIAKMLEDIPEPLKVIFTRYNVSDTTLAQMQESANSGTATVDSICEAIASPIAVTISNVIAFVLCFIVILVVLKLVISVVDNFFRLPVLKSANKGAGLVLGIVLAFIAVFVYSEITVQLFDALGSLSPTMFGDNAIEGTIIVKFCSEHSIAGIVGDILEKSPF